MKNTVNTAGVVRIVLYIIGALCGLAAVILPLAGIDHLTGLLAALAGAAATITGGTAVYNVPKATDQKQDLPLPIAKRIHRLGLAKCQTLLVRKK